MGGAGGAWSETVSACPGTCRSRPARSGPPGPPSSRRRSPATGPTAPSGPKIPRCRSARSVPGRSGTRRTSSTSSPGPTRPNTASWSRSPTRRSKPQIPGRRSCSAGCSPIPRNRKGKSPANYFATDFLTQMYKTTPGIKSKFNGVALHPYAGHYQSGLRDRRSQEGPQAEPRRRQGPLDHRARLELRTPQP